MDCKQSANCNCILTIKSRANFYIARLFEKREERNMKLFDVFNKKTILLLSLSVLVLSMSGCSKKCDVDGCKNPVLENELLCAEHCFAFEDFYDEITITGYNGINTDIIIPDEIKGKKVTKIGDNAFLAFENMTSITFNDNMHEIGKYSFSNCCNLSEIKLSNNITYIDEGAFSNCKSLESFDFNEKLSVIPPRMFNNCVNLDSIFLPNSISEIGENAFNNCENLFQVVLPESLYLIGDEAFANCTSLTELTLPANINTLGENFIKGTNITELYIPDSVTEIKPFTSDCLKRISFGTGLEFIPSKCFYRNETLEEVEFRGKTDIGSFAFYDCKNLHTVNMTGGTESISYSAFASCDNLTSFEIGYTDKIVIRDDAFNFSNNLSVIRIHTDIENYSTKPRQFYHINYLDPYQTQYVLGKAEVVFVE